MGDTPTHAPLCLIIIATSVLVSSSRLVLSSQNRYSRHLQTVDQHLSASPPTTGLPSSSQDGDDGKNGSHLQTQAVVGIVIAAFSIGCVLIGLLLFWFSQNRRTNTTDDRRKAQAQHNSSQDGQRWLKTLSSLQLAIRKAGSGSSATALDYALLRAATDNFSTNNLLGSGGSGSVYKARLNDDVFAAVKVLKYSPPTSQQLQHEFQTEIELMSKIRHPNLVTLLGYSIHKAQHVKQLLVYELMLNGSLEDQLHGPSQGTGLTWDLRIKIALDAARGLEYLHGGCSPPIIHRDFKSSNILLDASFNAKVSDFGLAIPMSDVSDDKSLELQGTFGYVAPEYLLDGMLSEKSDVYAFGVVLLELMTGRKPIDKSMPVGLQSLVTWVSPMLKERGMIMELLDSKLMKEPMDLKHLHQVAAIATLCIQSEPSYRPLMKDVVSSLTPLVPIELGGARRDAAGAERRMMMKMVAEKKAAEQKSLSSSCASKSFSEYSSIPEVEHPVARFSKSDRLDTDYYWV